MIALATDFSAMEDELCHNQTNQGKTAILASYSMFRGFLNAMDAQDPTCSRFFMCEASKEASKLGPVGKILAKVAR